LEKKLERDANDGIRSFTASQKTVNDFFEKYMSMKLELKPSTRTNYKKLFRCYIKDGLGLQPVGSIKYSDIKRFYLLLHHEKGLNSNTIHTVHTILHPVFALAVRDGFIRTNPAQNVYTELKRQYGWEGGKRHALTEQQQSAFMEYVRNSPRYSRWLTMFIVLLGTGCRVGEIIGLRWEDCDFDENIISINHNIIYCPAGNDKSYQYHISTPKTKAGNRIIPMLSAIRNALLEEQSRQSQTGFNQTIIDGYSGFIFQNHIGGICSPCSINRAIAKIIRDYNAEKLQAAEKAQRIPMLLPHFTVHNFRHTFCTRFCENETNIKVIQEIMGHADISTTMDVYNEATRELKKASFANLEDKIKIV